MLNRTGVLLMSVLTAAVIAHPSWERPFHGPPSDDVAFVMEHRFDLEDIWEFDCRQAPARLVYRCDVESTSYYVDDPVKLGYRVTVLR